MLVTKIKPKALRDTFSCCPSGVVAICALVTGTPIGLTVSTFVPVSLDPPLAGFCIRNDSTTWPRLAEAPRLGVSILSDGQSSVARRLASRTGGDCFAGVETRTTPEGALFLFDSCAWLDCEVESVLPAGDHGFVLLHVQGLLARPDRGALVFHLGAFRYLV